MALSLQGRALHFVFKVGDRKATANFYKTILGMQPLRHEEFSEGCEASCNGPYANRWSKTMIGYGPEDTHFVIELTYNYGVKSYELGNDFLGITIKSKEVIERAKENDWEMEELHGNFVIEAPGGFKYNLINEPQPKDQDPVQKVTLACSNLEKTIQYWNGILGLKIFNQSDKSAAFAFDESQCLLEFKDIGRPINHAKAYGRIAFSVPKASLPEIQEKIEKENHKVLTPLISLDTPGKATVSVVILADPDGHEICFVDDEGFRELSKVDPKADYELSYRDLEEGKGFISERTKAEEAWYDLKRERGNSKKESPLNHFRGPRVKKCRWLLAERGLPIMAAITPDLNTVQMRLRNAIYLYPMQRRVIELTNIMSECSLKDLQVFFPFLVEHIFGVNPARGNGWNLLRTSRKNNCVDFEALFRFLHPFGPFFELIYKLLGDVYLKYEYPLSFLTLRLKQVILEGSVPPFYADKLQIDPNLREPVGLVLNAFEFYLFHFAYHLNNSWEAHIDPGFFGGHETVYLHLTDQYLQYFLPIETSIVLPIVPAHQAMQIPRSPPPPQIQPQKTPKLFKNSVVKLGSSTLSPTTVSQPHAEIWRSEAFLQIIIDFWLSVPDQSINSNPFFNMKSQDPRISESMLPKEDHLRVVRNMIKHIHYFVNNFRNDGSAMDELRKAIYNLCRRPFYIFLRRHIYHWPLDSSFLLILETYLSFIQPWRYVKYNSSGCGESNYVDNKWFTFIVENFPAYNILIREIIPRFSRMDLTCPKHAHMLFRLSKVLSQPNLANILKDIEGHLEDSESSQLATPKSPSTPTTSGSPNSLSFPWFNRLNVIIRQEILDLESPNFQYKTLFGKEFHQQMFEFVLSIQQSLSLVKYLLNCALAQRKMKEANIIQRIKGLFFFSPTGDDYTIDERQKTVIYLEHSITFLSQVFDLPPLQPPRESNNDASNSTMNSSCSQQLGAVEPTVINPRDWKNRAKLIKYESNPDLEPIRSTEIPFLVRLLHHLSTRINERYRTQLKELWERNDFWGDVSRQLLAPPCKFSYFDKSISGNFAPKVMDQLPPRVCLRTLASHQTLSYIFLSGALAFLYGYPIVPFYFFIFFLFVCLILVKALLAKYLSGRRRTGMSPSSEPQNPVPFDADVSFTD